MSLLVSKTRREAPADETTKNAQLLIRAGFIHKEMAGVYDFLPLGLITLNNIMAIIRDEMNKIGGQEVLLSGLQNPEPWQASGRWSEDTVDVWFKTMLKNEQEIGLSNTHEEPLTALMANFVASYQDLPKYIYQFQTKFRNETRAKSGIMRTREFIMKDLYSFSIDQAAHDEFYRRCQASYERIFERLGLKDQTFLTFASGGSFAPYSHEFQTICAAGEDKIYVDKAKRMAVNKEVLNDDVLKDLGLKREELVEKTAAEVGNIFSLGTKYSDLLGLKYTAADGASMPVVMGSYGIGPARVMGVIAELMSDDGGLVWPESIAPFRYHLIAVGSEAAFKAAESVYEQLVASGSEVLFDDRDERPGAKFADADLIGLPIRLVVSDKTQGQIEYKKRSAQETSLVSLESLLKSE